MVKLLGVSLSLLLIGAGAARADAVYDTGMKTATSNVDFSQCGGAYVTRADDALNAAWKQTYRLVSGQTAKDLLAEEQAWIGYKEKSCLFYANGESGREGQVISFPGCRGRVIEQRTRDLVSIGKDLARH
jgi:uncharacterized protein YecT (DUF1311 family)